MEENPNFLSLFITENIYLLKEEIIPSIKPPVAEKQATAQSKAPQTGVPVEVSHHGQNQKKILLLVRYTQEQHISNEDAAFLEKILGAVKLTFEDVAIVNYEHHQSADHITLINSFDANTVISFGITHPQLLISESLPMYEITTSNQIRLLLANPLKEIASDNDKKRKLWGNLQKLFL